MKEAIQDRLEELKAEFEKGQKMLADLERKQALLRDSLLRISGAIQVLEEGFSNVRDQYLESTKTNFITS